jgi:outer membrane receptor protein involved in Fe transport
MNGLVSVGNWRWTNDVDSIQIYDENRQPILKTPTTLYLKNVHVGNVAQTVLGIGADYKFMENFTVGANYNYYDRLYAYFDPLTRTTPKGDVWQMPSYGLVDMNLKYNFSINGMKSTLIANVHNLLNTKYFSDGTDGDMSLPQAKMNALVWYGLGTTWTVGLKVNF